MLHFHISPSVTAVKPLQIKPLGGTPDQFKTCFLEIRKSGLLAVARTQSTGQFFVHLTRCFAGFLLQEN